jgi:hypothetical protein
VQSALTEHAIGGAHRGHVPPPQSMSVSAPFRTPSPQPAFWQCPPVHTPLAQSAGTVHCAPSGHLGHCDVPPQSGPLSPPFFTLSVHEGCAHRPPVHTPLVQSAASPHF